MIDREKVIERIHEAIDMGVCVDLFMDVFELLKEQEGYVSVPFSWLVKFCTHIDFVKPLTDAEREVAWRQKLRQQFGINVSKGGEVG